MLDERGRKALRRGICLGMPKWHPYTRLSYFKTFVRSTYEYGMEFLPTVGMCLKPQVKTSQEWKRETKDHRTRIIGVLGNLSELHKECLDIVCGTKSSHAVTMECVLGTPGVFRRCEELVFRFREHLLSRGATNPLSKVIKNQSRLMKTERLYLIILSDMGAEWEARKKTEEKIAIERYLRERRLPILMENSDISKWIEGEVRNRRTLYDECISQECAQKAIWWRMSSLVTKSVKCSVCGEMFTKSHVEKCNLLQENDRMVDEVVVMDRYLDILLNRKEYKMFEAKYDCVMNKIVGKKRKLDTGGNEQSTNKRCNLDNV
jgi:hypothetical protein